ncbi:Co2+/Mg2+ efflux protein ApaG [Alteromonas oceanisediminis]|uniref:Co2+/Mg2+ efflux protein ApaG n=1 Tax=Alteromonas oceanisediminis TaxID=2836180 RepID=UPI001BDA135C|nr:Co2+/Mg2+ efflux protein ApaG [Alteromonas oceanisediminis]MBT0585229.1 Co2+/Mg2+ efflux protein ApaG [Alteromonas oceanisediminis]
MVITPDIKVKVQTRFLEDQIPVEEGKFAFAYRVTVSNLGDEAAQLLTRYWLITDGNGKTSEVSGDGVVGKQPTIQPGESFSYTSGAVIETPVGSMQGYYEMLTSSGERVKAPIDVFSLRVPNAVN